MSHIKRWLLITSYINTKRLNSQKQSTSFLFHKTPPQDDNDSLTFAVSKWTGMKSELICGCVIKIGWIVDCLDIWLLISLKCHRVNEPGCGCHDAGDAPRCAERRVALTCSCNTRRKPKSSGEITPTTDVPNILHAEYIPHSIHIWQALSNRAVKVVSIRKQSEPTRIKEKMMNVIKFYNNRLTTASLACFIKNITRFSFF